MHSLAVILALLLVSGAARANDKVTFGLVWKAEAEYGGFYQAVTSGIYARHGLDLTIQEGGPQVKHTQLLLAGRLDFNINSNSFLALDFVKDTHPVSSNRGCPPTDALLAYGISTMTAHGVVDSRDAQILGIGAFSAERWAEFYQAVSDQGLYPNRLVVTKAHTLQFVNKQVEMD